MNLMRLFKSDEQQDQFVSTLVDPFKKDSIEDISLWIRRGFLSHTKNQMFYTATVRFQRGPTKGEHAIEAPDFVSLVKSVESFVKSLES
jgi:hypothetical protein